MKRRLRTRLDLLHPLEQTRVNAKQADQKRFHDHRSRNCHFHVGQLVLAQNLRGEPRWIPGTVMERIGPVSYKVDVRGKVRRRHVDQLLGTGARGASPTSDDTAIADLPPVPELHMEPQGGIREPSPLADVGPSEPSPEESVNSPPTPVVNRYPRRDRRPPDRLIDGY